MYEKQSRHKSSLFVGKVQLFLFVIPLDFNRKLLEKFPSFQSSPSLFTLNCDAQIKSYYRLKLQRRPYWVLSLPSWTLQFLRLNANMLCIIAQVYFPAGLVYVCVLYWYMQLSSASALARGAALPPAVWLTGAWTELFISHRGSPSAAWQLFLHCSAAAPPTGFSLHLVFYYNKHNIFMIFITYTWYFLSWILHINGCSSQKNSPETWVKVVAQIANLMSYASLTWYWCYCLICVFNINNLSKHSWYGITTSCCRHKCLLLTLTFFAFFCIFETRKH